MYVAGASIFLGRSQEPLASYQKRFNRLSGKRLRQINRFAYMGLIGAFDLVGRRRLPADTGIYLTTVNGNIADTEAAVGELYGSGRLPMPYNFIHTMANTATFYLSRELGVRGRNLTLSAGALSFERGLAAAASDFAAGWVNEALIGSIDEASGDRAPTAGGGSESPATGSACDEGCAWLHVTRHCEDALGQIDGSWSFADRRQAMDWLCRSVSRQPPGLLFTDRIGPAERAAWGRIADPAPSFDVPPGSGAFFEGSGCLLAAFFRNAPASDASVVMINRDPVGRYTATSLKRFGPDG